MKHLSAIVLGLVVILSSGCGNQSGKAFDFNKPAIYGLASPIQLRVDTTWVYMDDYLNDSTQIDSVWLDTDALEMTLDKNTRKLRFIPNRATPMLSNLFVKAGGAVYSLLIKKSVKQPLDFAFSDIEGITDVRIKGEFNSWDASQTVAQKTGDVWTATAWVVPGTYQYKYLVDGQEMNDPSNPDSVSNGMGGFNSLLRIGADNEQRLRLSADTVKNNTIYLAVSGADSVQVYAYWENYRIEPEGKTGAITIKLPVQANLVQRSSIRVFAADGNNFSNDLLIPLKGQHVVLKPSDVDSNDWRTSIMYFAMVDRFMDGDTSNNDPVDDPQIGAKANYYGGDLSGIIQKIEDGYFNQLGVNTLWISPIAQNPLDAWGQFKDPDTKFSGYHGYWPISSSKVDHRFGDAEVLEKLLETAHAHNIRVLLDYVANHVHKQHPVYQQHPDWVTNLYLPDGSLNTERWDDHRLTTWFDTFMPSLDLIRPEITNYMVDSALFWVNRFDFDGFRHDATKHIPENFWRTLTKRIKEASTQKGNHLYQIGETYGSYDLVGSYVNSGMLDGQFDFNLYDNALPVFANNEDPKRLRDALDKSLAVYGSHHMMGNITGNQDKPRIMSYADGSLPFTLTGMEQKRLGWKQTIGIGDTTGYKKVALFTAFNMTIPGIPIVYYGDEIGMPGAGDPDNRRMMRFDDLSAHEVALRNQVEALTGLRQNNLALLYGDFTWVNTSSEVLHYTRKYFNNEVEVVLNLGSTPYEYNRKNGEGVRVAPLQYNIDINK